MIHCHDWLTYPAGIEAKKVADEKGRKAPLISHVHATEFDRTGGNPNPYVYYLEREGMHQASYVLSVSNYTKNLVVRHYGINPCKVQVVHNSIDMEPHQPASLDAHEIRKHYRTVLFLGRMTIQKRPDDPASYFRRCIRTKAKLDQGPSDRPSLEVISQPDPNDPFAY